MDTDQPVEEKPAFIGQTFLHPNGIYAIWNPEEDIFIPCLRFNPNSTDLVIVPNTPVCRTLDCANNFHRTQEALAKSQLEAENTQVWQPGKPKVALLPKGAPLPPIHPSEGAKKPGRKLN